MRAVSLPKIPEWQVKVNIDGFGKFSGGYKVPLACPRDSSHSKRNLLIFRTSHCVYHKRMNLDVCSM